MQLKLIYFGTDLLSSCVDVFLDQGHSIEALYVGAEEVCTQQILEKVKKLSIPIFTERPTLAAMERHLETGVNLFFSAEYQFKIPVPDTLRYAVNLHTSLLPVGRGASTLPYLIERYPEAAGLTLHKLTENFDEGDIVSKHKIHVQSDESLNTLSVKMHLEAPKFLEKVLENFDQYYRQASIQKDGEYWQIPSVDRRIIDWYLPVERLRKQFKSFGHFGSIMRLDDQYWWVTYAEAIKAPSGRPPGDLLFQSNDLLAVSCLDGFVCIPKTGIKPVC